MEKQRNKTTDKGKKYYHQSQGAKIIMGGTCDSKYGELWTKRLIDWTPRDGVRNKGRQRTKWIDGIVSFMGRNA